MRGVPPNPESALPAFLAMLVDGIPAIQADLNQQWLDDIRELAALSNQPSGGGEMLLRSIAPSRLSFEQASIDARVAVHQSREVEFSFSVRPINMKFVRRYGDQSYSSCTLSVSVRQSPASPRDSSTMAGG